MHLDGVEPWIDGLANQPKRERPMATWRWIALAAMLLIGLAFGFYAVQRQSLCLMWTSGYAFGCLFCCGLFSLRDENYRH